MQADQEARDQMEAEILEKLERHSSLHWKVSSEQLKRLRCLTRASSAEKCRDLSVVSTLFLLSLFFWTEFAGWPRA